MSPHFAPCIPRYTGSRSANPSPPPLWLSPTGNFCIYNYSRTSQRHIGNSFYPCQACSWSFRVRKQHSAGFPQLPSHCRCTRICTCIHSYISRPTNANSLHYSLVHQV